MGCGLCLLMQACFGWEVPGTLASEGAHHYREPLTVSQFLAALPLLYQVAQDRVPLPP